MSAYASNGILVGVGGIDVGVMGVDVIAGIASCVRTTFVLTMDMAVSSACVDLAGGVDVKLLQDINTMAVRNKRITVLPMIFTFPLPFNVVQ